MTYKTLHTAIALLLSAIAFGQTNAEEDGSYGNFRLGCYGISFYENDEWTEMEAMKGVFHLNIDDNLASFIAFEKLHQYDLFDISFENEDSTTTFTAGALDDNGDQLMIIIKTTEYIDFNVVFLIYDEWGVQLLTSN
ncbi:MAG: hypothetical protein ABR574_11185 [Cryomorphaceae bacterium]|nr:hypothetical protein [Flavobacteriales bacterium]